MTTKIVRKINFAGKCPGGTYLDQMGKEKKCPQKEINVASNHPMILSQFNTGSTLDQIHLHCPRCNSEIKLLPEVLPEIGYFIDVSDLQ